MTMATIIKRGWTGSYGLLCMLFLGLGGLIPAAAQVQLGTLHVGANTYHNVTVTSQSANSIFIAHSLGFANIKVADVDPQVLAKLGYNLKEVNWNNRTVTSWADLAADPRIVALRKKFTPEMQAQLKALEKNLIMTFWCVLLAGFLFFSYCCQQICLKAGRKPGVAVWLPVLQLVPLFQTAGLSASWVLLILSPLLIPVLAILVFDRFGVSFLWLALLPIIPHAMAYMVWSVKICRARGMGNGIALLLMLPWTNLFAFLYLALGPAENKVQGFQPQRAALSRSTATDTAFFFQT